MKLKLLLTLVIGLSSIMSLSATDTLLSTRTYALDYVVDMTYAQCTADIQIFQYERYKQYATITFKDALLHVINEEGQPEIRKFKKFIISKIPGRYIWGEDAHYSDYWNYSSSDIAMTGVDEDNVTHTYRIQGPGCVSLKYYDDIEQKNLLIISFNWVYNPTPVLPHVVITLFPGKIIRPQDDNIKSLLTPVQEYTLPVGNNHLHMKEVEGKMVKTIE